MLLEQIISFLSSFFLFFLQFINSWLDRLEYLYTERERERERWKLLNGGSHAEFFFYFSSFDGRLDDSGVCRKWISLSLFLLFYYSWRRILISYNPFSCSRARQTRIRCTLSDVARSDWIFQCCISISRPKWKCAHKKGIERYYKKKYRDTDGNWITCTTCELCIMLMKLKKNQVTHSTSNCAVCVCSSERTSVAIRTLVFPVSY